MKKILCLGDSNTYGYCPQDGGRYGANERWTGLLAQKLEGGYEVIEAGLNNRNCFIPSPFGAEFCAKNAVLKYKGNFDYLIFALGINDLQFAYNPSLEEFEEGLKDSLSTVIKTVNAKNTILLAPPKLTGDILTGAFAFQFDKNSIEKSHKLLPLYEHAARENGAILVDLNKIVKVSPKDGLHLEIEAHRAIAENLARIISNPDV